MKSKSWHPLEDCHTPRTSCRSDASMRNSGSHDDISSVSRQNTHQSSLSDRLAPLRYVDDNQLSFNRSSPRDSYDTIPKAGQTPSHLNSTRKTEMNDSSTKGSTKMKRGVPPSSDPTSRKGLSSSIEPSLLFAPESSMSRSSSNESEQKTRMNPTYSMSVAPSKHRSSSLEQDFSQQFPKTKTRVSSTCAYFESKFVEPTIPDQSNSSSNIDRSRSLSTPSSSSIQTSKPFPSSSTRSTHLQTSKSEISLGSPRDESSIGMDKKASISSDSIDRVTPDDHGGSNSRVKSSIQWFEQSLSVK